MEERHGRGRGGSWRRGGGHDNDSAGGEHRGRGRGGNHRSRGKRDHYRGHGRGGHAPAAGYQPRNQHEDSGPASDWEEGRKQVFSRRKLETNWDRYLESEREEPADETPAVRGTDYHVLLESAGDSFTQFRFTEEKDWDSDSIASSQMSAVRLDLVALAQCLQALPLHQRLNLDADLVQVSTPLELPAATIPPKQDPVLFTRPVPAPKGPNSSPRLSLPGTPPIATPAQVARAAATPPTVDDADEELDRLLGLDKPVGDAIASQPAETTDKGAPLEVSLEVVTELPERAEPEPTPPVTAVTAKQEMTEEDLEDWLDSMIS